MQWKIVFTKQTQKDAKKIKQAGLKLQIQRLIEILLEDPFQSPPPYHKLVGDLDGAYSRRITIQHRLVYQVFKKSKTVKVIRMWTHYE
ncbi:MAG: Txe/YoeB family addiction module toxin [Candidatus Omnitrophica bacterium]|nr:Txe/YoeB family addiction module toxin [Candidatus Omnitrophota bacterium]